MMNVFPLTAFLFILPLVFGDRAERIQQIITDVDANADGLITADELVAEFAQVDANSDWVVTKDEFMDTQTGWPIFYGDSPQTTEAFFNNLDVACIQLFSGSIFSGCGRLGLPDLIQHYEAMDPDGGPTTFNVDNNITTQSEGDQVVTISQGAAWLDTVYP